MLTRCKNPSVKIDKSKFASLRPKNVVPVSEKYQTVCCCVYHENFTMLLAGIRKKQEDLPGDEELVKEAVCVSRLQNVGCHFPEWPRGAKRNNTCVVCCEKFKSYAKENPSTTRAQNPYSMTKTVFQCSDCLQFICISDGSTCWRDYHTKKEFWR